MESANSPNWLTKVFAPRTNFYSLLAMQSEKTLAGIEALQVWINQGAVDHCKTVRKLEHEADELVLELQNKLAESFITPFDREDISDLSYQLDEVINTAKATVREVEALSIKTTDAFLRTMSAELVEGTRYLHQSISSLEHNLNKAYEAATLARKSENHVSKMYQQAIKEIFMLDDFKKLQKLKEIYHYLVYISEKIDLVGIKLLHIIIKVR